MAEWRRNSEVVVTLSDGTTRNGKVRRIQLDGKILVDVSTGGQIAVTSRNLAPWPGQAATATTAGLLPDPPAGIARVASNTIASVLPSPVAEETNKSGIKRDF